MSNSELQMPTPAEWPKLALSDQNACKILSRGTAPVYVEHSSISAIGQRCIQDAGFDPSVARPHDETRVDRVLFAAQGDVLLNSTGTGTIGRSCVFEGDGKYIVDGHVTLIRPNPTKLNGRWLNALLQSHYVQNYLEKFCYSGSTNQVELSTASLASLHFPLPSTTEQNSIITVLNTLDTQIQATEILIAKLKQVKAGLLYDLLTRGIDEHGQLRDPVAHPEQFKNSQLGEIPKEWEVKPLSIIADLQVGFAFKSEWFQEQEGILLLRGENVSTGKLDWSDARRLSWSLYSIYKEYELAVGDVIIGMDRTFTKQGCKISVIDHEDVPALLVQRVGRFLPIASDRKFLRALLGSQYYQRALLKQQKGMDIPHLSKAEILKPSVAIPMPQEQYQIGTIINKYDAYIQKEETYLNKLKQLKRGLMHDLLTGQVRVPVAGEAQHECTASSGNRA